LTASISTTSQYTVVGYGGFGGTGVLWLAGMLSGWLLWRTRRHAGRMLRCGLMLAVLAAIGLSMTACSGKLPAQNPAFTSPGSYAVTVTATDGFLIHSATYNLSVSSK
jgi:CHASE2 domain-containing sensor protein